MRKIILLLLLASSACSLNFSPDGAPAKVNISGTPTVRIASPLPNATFMEAVSVPIQALVGNAGDDIDRVEITVNDTLITTLPQPNTTGAVSFSVTYNWQPGGAGSYAIAVTAYRADGSASSPARVSINVIAPGMNPTATFPPTQPPEQQLPTQAPTNAPPTAAPPTDVPASPTPEATAGAASGVFAFFTEGVNVRRGPGTNFAPPIGAYLSGQRAAILAVNPARDWYKVQFGSGTGWVYAPLVTVEGDTSTLPVDAGPPTPSPAPPTPVPPTPIPPTNPPSASQVNLVAGIIRLEPSPQRCAETFTIGFDVANLGAETSPSGVVRAVDLRASDGSEQGSTIGAFPAIPPGQTVRVDMRLTISTWYNENHQLVLTIDPDNAISETNNGDNRGEITYYLEKGNCG